MTRDEFLDKMLEKGKVTNAQIDKIKALYKHYTNMDF